jgi:hypothetical protein
MARRRPLTPKGAARPKRAMNPLTWDRAQTIPDKRKQANKRACRGRVTDAQA